MLSFIAWQMVLGVHAADVLAARCSTCPATQWSVTQVAVAVATSASSSTAGGFLAWMEMLRWLPAGTASLNMFAIPVIALLSSMAVFGERARRQRVDRHRVHRRGAGGARAAGARATSRARSTRRAGGRRADPAGLAAASERGRRRTACRPATAGSSAGRAWSTSSSCVSSQSMCSSSRLEDVARTARARRSRRRSRSARSPA